MTLFSNCGRRALAELRGGQQLRNTPGFQREPGFPLHRYVILQHDPISVALRKLLPREATLSVWAGDSEPAIYPEEARAVERAVSKRVIEFRRGRACARGALADLGVPPRAIPVGPDRAPIWPAGYVGSITHCAGLVAAVAAPIADVSALGFDAEPAKALPTETQPLLLHPTERRTGEDEVLETVVFSAKEAIHKALFPHTEVWMDFLDVVVELDTERGHFAAVPAPGGVASAHGLTDLKGRFAVTEGFVLAVGYLDAS